MATSWRLEDAKTSFSDVVGRARSGVSQRRTLRGRDTVVVSDAQTFDREAHTGQRLVDTLAESPIADLAFDRTVIAGPARDIEL